MEEDLEDINNLSNLWVDYESETYIYIYVYWENESIDIVLNKLEEFISRYQLICEKYKLAEFVNTYTRATIKNINEEDLAYFQKDHRRKILKGNAVYVWGEERIFPSLMFLKKNNEIIPEEIVNIDPVISLKNFVNGDNTCFAPPLMVEFLKAYQKNEIFSNIIIDNDCFLPYLDNKKTRRMENSDSSYTLNGVDATELAYLNATRLNSFIRDWRYLCFEYGATKTGFESSWMGYSKEKGEYYHTYSEDGVLFNDEIVYYEDVYDLLPDEHKVKNFEKIHYDIDKSFYEDFLKKQNIKKIKN